MSVINPITGRKITRGGRVYKSLVAAGHFMEDHMLPFKTKSSRRRKETKNEAYNWNVKYHVPPERSPSSSTIERAFANFSWRAPPPSSSSDDESFYTPPTSPRNRRRQYTPPGNPRFVSTPKPQRRKKSVYYTPPSSPIDGRVKPHTQQQKKHNSEAQQRRSLQAQLPFFPGRHSNKKKTCLDKKHGGKCDRVLGDAAHYKNYHNVLPKQDIIAQIQKLHGFDHPVPDPKVSKRYRRYMIDDGIF